MATEPELAAHPNVTPTRRISFILSIWSERQADQVVTWRGYIETSAGERTYFASLDDLTRELQKFTGWVETNER